MQIHSMTDIEEILCNLVCFKYGIRGSASGDSQFDVERGIGIGIG